MAVPGGRAPLHSSFSYLIKASRLQRSPHIQCTDRGEAAGRLRAPQVADAELLARYRALLAPAELAHAEGAGRAELRLQRVLARALVRTVLARRAAAAAPPFFMLLRLKRHLQMQAREPVSAHGEAKAVAASMALRLCQDGRHGAAGARRYCGLQPRELVFERGRAGKPELCRAAHPPARLPGGARLRFNLSHTPSLLGARPGRAALHGRALGERPRAPMLSVRAGRLAPRAGAHPARAVMADCTAACAIGVVMRGQMALTAYGSGGGCARAWTARALR